MEYGFERTVQRIAVSKYADHFTLKGGMLLYALFDGVYPRVTTDIDFLAERLSNNIEDITMIFREIFSYEADDPLVFRLDTMKVIPITEFKKYHGVRVSIMAYLDRTRIPVTVDIGFGDAIYPERSEVAFPVLLSDEIWQVYAYSLYTAVAEKFDALVTLAYDNSRFKDYYDLYVLAVNYDFDGAILKRAVGTTLRNRHTELNHIAAFEEGFSEHPLRKSRWNAFVRKKKPMLQITFEDTINLIHVFMEPVIDALVNSHDINSMWNHTEKLWIDKNETVCQSH